MPQARYNATVLSEVTTGTALVHSVAAIDAARVTQTETAGVPCRGLTQRTCSAKGVPWSRASENSEREAEVMQARPQNHIAIEISADMALPAFEPSPCWSMATTAEIWLPWASLAASTPGMLLMASVSASTRK